MYTLLLIRKTLYVNVGKHEDRQRNKSLIENVSQSVKQQQNLHEQFNS